MNTAPPLPAARARRGFARIARERTIDFRHAAPTSLVAERATPFAASEGTSGGGAPPAITVPVAPDALADDLRQRLLARLQTPLPLLLLATGPIGWPEPLFPYQREGVRVLMASDHLLLGDEMGLGKTIQVIAALRLLTRQGEIERSLVVVPASLVEQWRRAFAHWSPELRVLVVAGLQSERDYLWRHVPAHVTLVSYDTLRNDADDGPAGERVWDVVALDEAQRIKNRETGVADVCKRLRRRRSWAMTGTPLENRESDVASILEFVQGGGQNPATRLSFASSGWDLRLRLAEFQLRRRKRDVLADLPPKISSDIVLPLLPAQRRAYDEAEQEGIQRLKSGGVIRIENVLTLIARLKQICNFAPAPGAPGVDGSVTSAKMDDLRERIAEIAASGSQALVFSQYVQAEIGGARRIAAELAPWNALVFAGDMAGPARERQLTAFRDDPRHAALVLSLRAGGQGLNLQNAAYVFHFDRWWNPAVELQAEDRAHRLGQTQSVHVYRYITEDTIEARIDAILRAKRDLFDQVVEGATLDVGQLLTKREIFGLFGLEG